jgi:NADH dehydrogenase FAD-containing subunit
MIIIEQKSHYNYVYAFPRASVKPGFEQELFVPYAGLFLGNKNVGQVVQAKVSAIHPNHVELDRSIEDFGKCVPFSHLIFATGTTIPAPGHFNADSKAEGIACLKTYQDMIRQSKKPLIIGGGAVGLGNYNKLILIGIKFYCNH